MVDLTKFHEGVNALIDRQPILCSDPRSEFLGFLTSCGFTAPRVLKIGNIDRIKGTEDTKGKESGWYVYHEIEDSMNDGAVIGIANYGDWKNPYINGTWSSRSENQMSTSERSNYLAQREAMKLAQEIEQQLKHKEAAQEALDIWKNAKPADDTHAYLVKKQVKSTTGLKVGDDGRLIIPVAIDNEIATIQYIKPNGEKRFLTGGKKKGGWFVIDGDKDVIYIAEGYSTGHSIHQATGATVYVAFDAGNLYEVCVYVNNKHKDSIKIIAGDDDTGLEVNAGRVKAEQASSGLGIDCIFPLGYNDFNDMHVDLGLEKLTEYLKPKKKELYEPKENQKKGAVTRPDGVLGDMYDYYNVTSGNDQKGFAIQTALAVCSLILGRSYKTNYNNFTSLFFLNVGETSTGKEHAKYVFEKILHETGNGAFISGDGYTSAGAVMSTLLDRPKHGTCTDELGRYLEAAMSKSGGNNNQREANTRLMEAFGRCDGMIRPQNYSSMTMKKQDADSIKNRLAHNPAITWLSMTTPSTLFSTIDINAVKDGFINRFVISISDAEPDIRHHKEPVAVPDRIIKWANDVRERNPKAHIATEKANVVVVPLSTGAYEAQISFQRELLVTRKNLKKYRMEGLTGRTNEEAMRISLIYCLSKNPMAQNVDEESMTWAIDYMRKCLNDTIKMLKFTISSSEYESNKKEILSDLRERAEMGITWAEMNKTPPYSQHKRKELKEIMQSLVDSDLVQTEIYKPEKGGRPSEKWSAVK